MTISLLGIVSHRLALPGIFDSVIRFEGEQTFVELAQAIGPSEYYKYFEDFGFTEKMNVDLPAPAKPQVYSEEKQTR